jgi:hypothetical protein
MKRSWVKISDGPVFDRDAAENMLRIRLTEAMESDAMRQAFESHAGMPIEQLSPDQLASLDQHKRRLVDQGVADALQRIFPN